MGYKKIENYEVNVKFFKGKNFESIITWNILREYQKEKLNINLISAHSCKSIDQHVSLKYI